MAEPGDILNNREFMERIGDAKGYRGWIGEDNYSRTVLRFLDSDGEPIFEGWRTTPKGFHVCMDPDDYWDRTDFVNVGV